MALYDKASLVLIPSGTKEGVVFSQKPTNGDGDFTFSRSTSATRVGPSGYIEKETQNLILQSNSFDTTWSKTNITLTSGQSGYDGSSDAWLVTKTLATAYTPIYQPISSSGVQTFSVYAKAGTLNLLALFVSGGTNPYVVVDLSTGLVTGSRGGAEQIDYNVEDVGSGWYRISYTYNVSITNAYLYPDWNQTNTGTLYIQDAQLEQGLVARDYIETTTSAVYGGITDNIPRLDYTDSSCPSLLLEPQRTNLLTQSEYLESANFGFAQILNTTDTTPEGSSNARVLAYDGGTNQHYVNFVPSVTNGQTYTFSVFLKKKELQYAALIFLNDFAGQFFDLENGTILGAINGGPINSTIKDYGNGWYRCSITDVATSTTKYSGVYLSENGTAYGGFTPTNTDGIYIYGMQLEQGSYATSYIPTYGSAVTRNNETLSSDTSSFGISNEFTLFIDTNGMQVEGTSLNSMDDLRWYSQASDYYRFYKTSDAIFISNNIRVNDRTKIALKVNSTECKTFVDGVLISTISLTTPFSSFDSISKNSEAKFKDSFNKIILFPTALTDEEAIALTTI